MNSLFNFPNIVHTMLLLISLFPWLTACSSEGFTGGSASKAPAAPAASSAKADVNSETAIDQSGEQTVGAPTKLADEPVVASEVLGSSDDEKKLLSCISQWGNNTFTKSQLQNFKTLTSEAQGFSSAQIVDSKKTASPSLVLIKVKTTGFNAAELQLLNPNGYYCIDSDQTGFSNLRIIRTCQAEVASDSAKATGFNSQNTTLVDCGG